MYWETYAAYLAVIAAFFATPPDTSQLLMMSNSITHGVRRALFTVAGDLSANILQMTAAAFGLTVVIASSADALSLVKWVGVAYLAWIGLKLFFAPARLTEPGRAGRARAGALYRQGLLTSGANPYAVVFFAALFPQFINPALPVLPQLLILGVTYLAVDGIILILWGVAATRAANTVRNAGGRLINRISGALMIAAAALLALKDFENAAPRREGVNR